LALVEEGSPCTRGAGRVQVAIVQHGDGTVASEFGRDFLQTASHQLADAPSHSTGARESNQPNRRRGDQNFSHIGAAGKHREDARRQTGHLEDSSQEITARRIRVLDGKARLPDAPAGP
jgi:hypothetical protein